MPEVHPAATTPGVSGVMPIWRASQVETTEDDAPLSIRAVASRPLTFTGTTILLSFSIGTWSAAPQ
jgi:hypothetical protein